MNPRYGWAHRKLRKQWALRIALGYVQCAEPICLEERDGRSRTIPSTWANTQRWHLCHDATTGQTIGPGHARCNLDERTARLDRAPKAWIL